MNQAPPALRRMSGRCHHPAKDAASVGENLPGQDSLRHLATSWISR